MSGTAVLHCSISLSLRKLLLLLLLLLRPANATATSLLLAACVASSGHHSGAVQHWQASGGAVRSPITD